MWPLARTIMCATFIEPLCMCYFYMLYCRMWTLNVLCRQHEFPLHSDLHVQMLLRSLLPWIFIFFRRFNVGRYIRIMQVQVIAWKDLFPKWPILHLIVHKPVLGTQYSMILQPLAAISDIFLWLRVIDFFTLLFLKLGLSTVSCRQSCYIYM